MNHTPTPVHSSPTRPTSRAVHWAVKFDSGPAHARPAIPFTLFAPAYSLAKRATNDNHPASAIEVYEVGGKFYDVNGAAVNVRGVA